MRKPRNCCEPENFIAKVFVAMPSGSTTIQLDGHSYSGEWERGFPVSYQRVAGPDKPYTYGLVPDYASALYAREYIPGTLGYFTGVRDIDDTPIFTGDIVRCQIDGLLPNWYEREIVFYEGTFGVWVEKNHFEPMVWFSSTQVVANKYGQRFVANDK